MLLEIYPSDFIRFVGGSFELPLVSHAVRPVCFKVGLLSDSL